MHWSASPQVDPTAAIANNPMSTDTTGTSIGMDGLAGRTGRLSHALPAPG
ncbi:hypothetical protein [Nocardia carnea]|nr:hypothetical protein [Nocardia carnea]